MISRSKVSIFADQLTRLLLEVIRASMEETMIRTFAIGTLVAALTFAGSARLSAQDAVPGDWRVYLFQDGQEVYDVVNRVTWLADANLPAKTLPDFENFRFGLPLCPNPTIEPTEPCVNLSGSMNYTSAVAWVQGMNAANYLGHSDWQMPTAPLKDPDCSGTGPAPYRENFAFGCDTGALGYLYYTGLGLKAPNTAVPIPPNKVGPFRNLQPNIYWSGSPGGGLTCTIANFDFASGAQGGGCGGDFGDVLPMIEGETLGMPIPSGSALYVNPGGQTVYDPETNITWLADANLAKRETFGLPRCKTAPDTTPCVARDGSMNYESAMAWVNAMNAYVDPITNFVGYLGQTNWTLPSLDASCPTYGCGGNRNPMGNLYYDQLNFPAGTPVVAVPDIAVGPFHHLLPFPYWSCLADTIQEPCNTAGNEPSANSEWGFSFGTGYLGTERLPADRFVTAYFRGCDLPDQKKCSVTPYQ
jgi:hypothetical protein